jgi:hypothetical protein
MSLTVENTSMARASGVGRADLLFLHLALSTAHPVQRLHESTKRRNTFGLPDLNTSRSRPRSLSLMPFVHSCLCSGFASLVSKRKATPSLYSRKKSLHSWTVGVLGGQQAFFSYSLHPNTHFILTHSEITMFFGSTHLKSMRPCLKNNSSRCLRPLIQVAPVSQAI